MQLCMNLTLKHSLQYIDSNEIKNHYSSFTVFVFASGFGVKPGPKDGNTLAQVLFNSIKYFNEEQFRSLFVEMTDLETQIRSSDMSEKAQNKLIESFLEDYEENKIQEGLIEDFNAIQEKLNTDLARGTMQFESYQTETMDSGIAGLNFGSILLVMEYKGKPMAFDVEIMHGTFGWKIWKGIQSPLLKKRKKTSSIATYRSAWRFA